MSLKTYLSPNGDEIVAVLVLTPGSCGIVGIKDDGTPEFDGTGTVHFYDDQYELTRNGKMIFVCDEGYRWTLDQLVDEEAKAEALGFVKYESGQNVTPPSVDEEWWYSRDFPDGDWFGSASEAIASVEEVIE